MYGRLLLYVYDPLLDSSFSFVPMGTSSPHPDIRSLLRTTSMDFEVDDSAK